MKTKKNGRISRVMAISLTALLLLCAGAFAVVSITSPKKSADEVKNTSEQNPQGNDRSIGTLIPAAGGMARSARVQGCTV